ncbi:site-specific integrase [Halomonas daqingensis]|uniref:Site-specific integrase n=1 Tax=Billgrantia desiderata TaxID=52021 RepID=A0AAW4YUI8_9GAMM|nr:site-specific integrase [Halomonas desiderata]MCE8052298.1 site-specific integrase [Halomonas desiderata]
METSGKSPAYLTRSRHGIWYFRLVVPPYAWERVGQKVIKRSLKTRLKREAVLKASSLLIEVNALMGRSTAAVESHGFRVPHIEPALPSPPIAIPSPSVPQTATKTLTEVFESYRHQQELEGVSLKTLDDKQAVVALLVRIVGDKPIAHYSIETAMQFRKVALTLPPLATRTLSQKPHLSMEQLIEKADKTISITTYNNYVKNLITVFEYAISLELIHRNPFSGMKIKQKRKESSYRDEFSEEEIQKIFTATQKEKGWKYWLPLLGYYGAFRLNEACQLYKADVKKIDGVYCIHVNQESPDKRLKNVNTERVVPIHDELIRLGFLEYVDSIKEGKRLFDLRWTEKHGYSGTPSKWFGRLRNKLKIEECGKGKKDFHSFRHTVANQLKQQGVIESMIGGVLGHTTGGITNSRYGKDYNPDVLLPVVNMIKVIAKPNL